MAPFRIGCGYDVHRIVPGRPLVLGGVAVEASFGLEGHSDADVLTHAVIDAVLGALAAGDIGAWFPDTDPRWRGADSLDLLARVLQSPSMAGFRLGNLDAVILAQAPKLAPRIPAMRANLARLFGAPEACVSVKATTSERLGFAGRGEGIAAWAVVLLQAAGGRA